MTDRREELSRIAQQWIALWCVPTDWVLFDQLHAEHFTDCAAVGRGTDKAAFAQSVVDIQTAFPDLHAQVEDVAVDVAIGRVAVR